MVTSAAIYARISSDREGDHLGVDRQVAECRKIADRLGYRVVGVYVDDNISAHSGKHRPEYVRLLGDMCDRSFDELITFAMDRLHRQGLEQEEFFEICKGVGMSVVHTMGGPVDLGSYMGKAMARFSGLVASMESDIKSTRSRAKHAELAQAGKVSGGGARPYGYETDRRTIVPAEAEVLSEAARRVLAGDSVRSICADLDDRGIPAASGGPWNPSVLTKLLRSGRISGQREHHGEIVGPAEWPGIIRPEDTARLRAALGAARRGSAPSPRRYLLAGLLRCQLCGATLISRPKAGGVRQYVCGKGPGLAGCGKLSVVAEPVELLIVDAISARLDTPTFARYVERGITTDRQADKWRTQLAAAEGALAQAGEMFGAGEMDRIGYLAASKAATVKRDQAKARLSALAGTTVLDGYVGNGEELRRTWDGLDLTRQAAIVAAVIDHAVVAPAVRGRNRFDEDRVRPVWKR